jgi:nucleotidyltransferase substrate binding protein (TIGR01987 family)
MESTELYHLRLKTLQSTIKGFEASMNQNTDRMDPVLKDLVRNGQLQKFEYCSELLWKMMKHYLFIFEALDEATPKRVCKAFYQVLKIDQKLYQDLIDMIDSRNISSHVYCEPEFVAILKKLPSHLDTMKSVLSILKKQSH